MEHSRHRAVIPFQSDNRTILEVVAKTIDVADVRTAEPVNSLVVIPHHEQILPVAKEQAHHPVLRRVDVLVFVHHDVFPHFVEKGTSFLVRRKEPYCQMNQVVKHDLPRLKDLGTHTLKFRSHRSRHTVGKQVFAAERLDVELGEFRQKFPVRGIPWRWRNLKAQHFVGVSPPDNLAEHKKSKRMERTQAHARIREKRLHALAHLGSSFRRKRKRKDFFGSHSRCNPVLDSLCEHRSFSGTRTGEHEQLGTFLEIM